MKKLKSVGAGPVSAQNKTKAHWMHSVHLNFNGITLIALIITIIVMLILVGVTITVALNGGLFETATKAATGTQKEKERERLTEVALASYNVSESKISDVDSLVGKLSSMGFSKDESKSSVSNAKLVVQGKSTLWQIDLNTAEVSEYLTGDIYRVAYEYTDEETGLTGSIYLLEEGILVMKINNQLFYAVNVNIDGKKLSANESDTSIEISLDGNSIQIGEEIYKKNPEKKFSYNCYLNENLGIYNDAYYLNNTAKSPLVVYYDESKYRIFYSFDDAGRSIDISGITTKDEFTAKLAEYNMSISNDGKEITYDGRTYTLMEK